MITEPTSEGRSGRRRRRCRGYVLMPPVLLIAVGATGGPVGAVTGPHEDAPAISDVVVTPGSVVLPAAAKGKAPIEIQMHVRSPLGIDSVVVGLYGPDSRTGMAFRLSRSSGSVRDGTWRAKGAVPSSETPGEWRVQAFAVDKAQRSSDANEVYSDFQVRTPTRFVAFSVTRDDQESGFRLAATLQRWQAVGGWLGTAAPKVRVEFRPDGAKEFGNVETVAASPDGSVAASPRTDSPVGEWRLRYLGDELGAPSLSSEVAVIPVPPQPTAAPTAAPTGGPGAAPALEPTATPAPTGGPNEAPAAGARPTPSAATARPIPSPTATPVSTASPTATPGPTAAPSAPPPVRSDVTPTSASSDHPSDQPPAGRSRRVPSPGAPVSGAATVTPPGTRARTSGRLPNR